MKKTVTSLSLAAMLALGTLSGAVSAADPQTAQEKYDALVEAGIFEGFPDGEAHLDRNMTRAQAAKVVALVLGLEPDASAASKYDDVKDSEWSAGYVGAITKAGIVEGKGNGVFDPNAPVTVEELAKIMVKGLGINTSKDTSSVSGDVSNWAKEYVDAALKLGLIGSDDTNYKSPANRASLVDVSYDAIEIVSGTGQVKESNKPNIGKLLALGVMTAENGQFKANDNLTKADITNIVNALSDNKFDWTGVEVSENPTFAEMLRLYLQALGYPASELSDGVGLIDKAIAVGMISPDSPILKVQLLDAPVKREWTAAITADTAFKAGKVEVKEDGTVVVNKDKHLSDTMTIPSAPIKVDVADIENVPSYSDLAAIDPSLETRVKGSTQTPAEESNQGPSDTTAPRITGASVNGNTDAVTVTDGKTITVDVQELTNNFSNYNNYYITSGMIKVSEASTLKITSIEGYDLANLDEEILTKRLSSGENSLSLSDLLISLDPQSDGISLTLLTLLEDSSQNGDDFVIKGELRDSSGNKRDVEFVITNLYAL